MSNARSEFQTRIGNLGTALKEQALVGNPLDPMIDGPAALMRNGLAVVSFAILEDFIRRRAGEVMSRVSSGPTSFVSLPNRLRTAAIRGALAGVIFQERILEDSVWVVLAQTHSDRVASTARTPYQLSELSFGYDQSNLDVKTVTAILEAFKIENPWSCIGGVASRCGVGTPALKDSLSEATKRRHAAAHQANASVPQ